METAARLRELIVEYYSATTEDSYLASWSGRTLAMHLGLSDDPTPITTTERGKLDDALMRMNAFIADRAGIHPGCRILDAGCGVGGSAIYLARERQASVVGITLDPGQVELARGFAKELGVSDASFEVMDFEATAFPAESFDVVWNLESFSHCGEPLAYLAHAHELLRAGGRFICTDYFRGSGGNPADCDDMCRGWVQPNLHSVHSIAAELERLGFVDIEVVELTPQVLPSAAAMSSFASSAKFFLHIATASGAPPRPVHRGHFEAAISVERGLRTGSITYHHVRAYKRNRV
jgi:tocopherol O-methyltransferase